MPAPIAAVIASRPSMVAGILIITLGRSTLSHSAWACSIVRSVSWARSGATSIDTRPSYPPLAS